MKSDQRDGQVVSPPERAAWVRRYRASGLGLRKFAAEHGLTAGQLRYWVYGLGPARVSNPGTPLFREVRLTGPVVAPARWGAEVVLPRGLVVRLREEVERERFAGTCYRAANWRRVGATSGRSRADRQHTLRVPVKDVYVRPLRSDFRVVLYE